MKGEINHNYFCLADEIEDGFCSYYKQSLQDTVMCKSHPKCPNRHRKWPTLKQFKEEYGEDYSEYGLVWVAEKNNTEKSGWEHYLYRHTYRYFDRDNYFIVCACTPWGKPPNGWRPE